MWRNWFLTSPQVVGLVSLVVIVVFRSIVLRYGARCAAVCSGVKQADLASHVVSVAPSGAVVIVMSEYGRCGGLASRSWTTTTRSGLCTAVHSSS